MAETESAQDVGVPEVVAMVHRMYRDGRDASSEWRKEAETWYGMVAGDQWDTNDLMRLKDQQRPAVVFNRIMRTVNAVTGTQVANRQETRFLPREQGDIEVNEILTAAADWARDNTDAEDEESDAFLDMTTCGMGWTDTHMSYDVNPEGDISIERLDPIECYWDPGARKKNLSDARWVMHVRSYNRDEFKEKWPDADIDLSGAPWEGAADDDISNRTHVYPQDAYQKEQSGLGPKSPQPVRVAHVQWLERRRSYRVGKRAETLDAGMFDRLRPKLDEQGIKYMSQPTIQWRRAVVAGGEVLEEGDAPFPNGPTLRCMTYMRDRNKRTWFGLVKPMVDPQRFGNKLFSQFLDILNKGSKGGIMVEEDAVEDFRELESRWARPDAVIKVRSGALGQGKIKEKPLVNFPQGMDRLMAFAMDSIHEIPGVSLELLGLANRDQPGVLEDQRKRAGLTILAPLFDAMRRYRKEQGRVLLHFIQEFLSDGRLIRIMGENGREQYIPLVRQSETARYDVIVDEAPTSPNMRERVYGALVQLLPTLAKLGVPMPAELLDYAPIPSALAAKWKEQIQQGQQMPPEAQKQMQEMGKELQRLAEENKKLSDKREQTVAEIQMKQAETKTDMEIQRTQVALKQEETQAGIEIDRWKTEETLRLQREKMEGELMMKTIQAMANGDGDGNIDLDAIRRVFRDREPRTRRLRVSRDADGFIESADIEDVFPEIQGNA